MSMDGYDYYKNNSKLLIEEIDMKLDECDFDFFAKLGELFQKFGEEDKHIASMLSLYLDALADSISINGRSSKFDTRDINGDNLISGIIRRAIFNYSYVGERLVRRHRKKTDANINNLYQLIELVRQYGCEYEQKHGMPFFMFPKRLRRKFGTRSVPVQSRMVLK